MDENDKSGVPSQFKKKNVPIKNTAEGNKLVQTGGGVSR